MKRLAVGIVALVLLVVPAALAAPTADEVAADASTKGFFIEEGLPATPESISASVSRARNAGIRFYAVLLVADPPGGATTFADAVYDRVGGSGTVLVLSAGDEGVASSEFDQPAIEAALDHAFANSSDDEGYVASLVDHLIDPSAAPSGGGGGAGRVLLVVFLGVAGLVAWGIVRSSKKSRQRTNSLVEEARAELQVQIAAVANKLLEIADIVSASDTKKDDEHLRLASTTFTEIEESHRTIHDLRELEHLSDRLDEARWQLEAAEAIAYDRPVPPRPAPTERPVCFFDPAHTDATETAEIQTASGTRTVRVCKADADLLKRGQAPEPRMVTVEGEQVPAPTAPKSHGGSGFDGLDLFTILMSGGRGRSSYDWGSTPRRARQNTWSSGSSRTAGSGSRSSTTRSSTRSSSGSSARAGRTRKRDGR
jgi:hypothetical protein